MCRSVCKSQNVCPNLNVLDLNVSREFKDGDIENEIREAFRVFDKEGNGFITSQDLMEVKLVAKVT